MKRVVFFLAMILVSTFLNAQKLRGMVTSNGNALPRAIVLNLTTEQEVFTKEDGSFEISANEDDLLLFERSGYEKMRHLVDVRDFKKALEIKLEETPVQLEEIVVYQRYYDPVKMGILQKQPKRLSVAERRLYTANSTSIDGLINAISGRTAMLKRSAKAEKNEIALKQLENMFNDEYFTEQLKISRDDLGRFKYYVVEQPKVKLALASKNKFNVMFVLSEYAQTFKTF